MARRREPSARRSRRLKVVADGQRQAATERDPQLALVDLRGHHGRQRTRERRIDRAADHDHGQAVCSALLVGRVVLAQLSGGCVDGHDARVRVAGGESRPGKCLSVYATPCEATPWAKAHARSATSSGLFPNDRVPRNDPGACSTSATGARSTFTPAERSSLPVASPSLSAVAADVMSAGARSGGPASRLTVPPSWSVMIKSTGLSPWAAVACSSCVSRRVASDPAATLSEKRITPPTSPRRMRSRSDAGGVEPANRATII